MNTFNENWAEFNGKIYFMNIPKLKTLHYRGIKMNIECGCRSDEACRRCVPDSENPPGGPLLKHGLTMSGKRWRQLPPLRKCDRCGDEKEPWQVEDLDYDGSGDFTLTLCRTGRCAKEAR